MRYDTRSSTLIARGLISQAILAELLAARMTGMPVDEAAKARARISTHFRTLIDEAIAALAKTPTAHTSTIIGELPAKRDEILEEVLAATPVAPAKPPTPPPSPSQLEKKS